MNRMRFYTTLGVILCFSVAVFPQKKKLEKADKAFYAGEYTVAIDLYKNAYTALNENDLKTYACMHVADCYRLTNLNEQAELWYKKAFKRGYSDPMAILNLAYVLKVNQKYDQALGEYRRFKQAVPDDQRGTEGILSCEKAKEWLDNPGGYMVEDMKSFNSRESDFSPAFASDDYGEVYFTSSRDESTGNRTHGATGESYSDIFSTSLDRKGKWSVPVPLGETINTEFEEGTPCLTANFKELYFTRCVVVKRKKMGCQIYHSSLENGKWGKTESMPIADDSLVVAHPSISSDGLILYFTSDMPGGFGGKDLWKCTRSTTSEKWGKPENLGEAINTLGDEMFPFVHPNGDLYFASDGQIGMGGLDIFKATLDENGKWTVTNLGAPVNSSADDFGITFQADEERGFFSSSRKGKGNDDIYSFVLPPLKFNIVGIVRDEKTEEALEGAKVKLVGSDGITIETETGNDGTFRFLLKPATDYVFLATKQGYLNGKGKETTKGQDKSRDFRMTILLSSITKPIELSNSNVFYDFARWDLRPEAMVSLDRLVETLNDNPGITIELRSHTDSRDTEEFNLDLSQKRAQSVVDYLIEKGISPDRLHAKGYGESMPKVVTKKIHDEYPFLKEGAVLSETYINSLADTEQKEIAHQLNRRTEFQVLSTNYK